jgi:hypothetical protein
MREQDFSGEILVNVERDPRVRLQAVPEHVVVGGLALLRNLRRLCLQLLEAENVRLLLREPLAYLRGAGADAVDVPGRDFSNFRSP